MADTGHLTPGNIAVQYDNRLADPSGVGSVHFRLYSVYAFLTNANLYPRNIPQYVSFTGIIRLLDYTVSRTCMLSEPKQKSEKLSRFHDQNLMVWDMYLSRW